MANVQADRYWRGGILCIVKRLASISGGSSPILGRAKPVERSGRHLVWPWGAVVCAKAEWREKAQAAPTALGRAFSRSRACRCARSCVRGLPAFADKRNHLSRSFGHSMKEHDKRELSSLTDNPPPEVRYRSNSFTAGISRCLECQ